MLHSESLDYRVRPCLKKQRDTRGADGKCKQEQAWIGSGLTDLETQAMQIQTDRKTASKRGAEESEPGPTGWRRDEQGEMHAKDKRQTGEERGPKGK